VLSYESRIYNSNDAFRKGTLVTFKYDNQGRILEQIIQNYDDEKFTKKGEREENSGFIYDANGNVKYYESRTYNADGTFKEGHSVSYDYNNRGRLRDRLRRITRIKNLQKRMKAKKR